MIFDLSGINIPTSVIATQDKLVIKMASPAFWYINMKNDLQLELWIHIQNPVTFKIKFEIQNLKFKSNGQI